VHFSGWITKATNTHTEYVILIAFSVNEVEDNLRKLGVKRWRTKVLEREEWASIVKEAKAKLKGP
jgi:hypothetical protein